MTDNKIHFIIPGLYEHPSLNFMLLELLKKHPEYFRDNIDISAVYGSFQFCIFDGGRIFTGYRHTTKEEIEQIVNTYNEKYQVPIRLVCTNPILEQKHFYDRFGNLVLKLCENDINEIVINNEAFQNYVQDKYPSYSFISSTTKCLAKIDDLKKELDNPFYKMVCLDYNLNKNWNFLNSLTDAQKFKCEFLCNAICAPGCSQRKEHYKLNGLHHLSYGQPYTIENCSIKECALHPEMASNANNISPEELYEKYVPAGFNLFKLEGRTLGLTENAITYTKFLAKPKWQPLVLDYLMADDAPNKIFHVYNN